MSPTPGPYSRMIRSPTARSLSRFCSRTRVWARSSRTAATWPAVASPSWALSWPSRCFSSSTWFSRTVRSRSALRRPLPHRLEEGGPPLLAVGDAPAGPRGLAAHARALPLAPGEDGHPRDEDEPHRPPEERARAEVRLVEESAREEAGVGEMR